MQDSVFKTINQRFSTLFFDGDVSENVERELSLLKGFDYVDSLVQGDLPNTMKWEDIDYANQDRSAWHCAKHYARIIDSLLRNGRVRLETDESYRNRLLAALRFWTSKNFKNPNWWHNDIGTPRNIGTIASALWEYLDEDLKASCIAIVGCGSMKSRQDIPRWTGANLIWGIMNTLRHAVLTEDEQLLKAATDRAIREFKIGFEREEGIKPDGSFWQHGARLYSGGYGQSFAEDATRLAYYLQKTPFEIPRTVLSRLTFFLLEGIRPMVHKAGLDYQIIGREFARVGTCSSGRILRLVRMLLLVEDVPSRDQLQQFEQELSDKKDPEERVKYFPYVDMMTSTNAHTYMSVKNSSNMHVDAEVCNGEGELCYNMSYGTHLCLMHSGKEYLDIAPVWDYAHIPGTTARRESDSEILAHRSWWNLPLPSAISGGLQKEKMGILYEYAEHDGIHLYSAAFFIPGKLILLGAGIIDEKGETLDTTLNQCHLHGEIRVHEDGSVSHDGFRYQSLDPQVRLQYTSQEQIGSWKRNNFEMQDREVSSVVLTVKGECKPTEHDAYAYLISDELADETCGFTIVCNRPDRQAIRLDDGTILEVNYTVQNGYCQIYKEMDDGSN